MYNYLDLQDTITAIATAQGTGAIAIIRLSGKDAIQIANQFFSAKDLTKVSTHTVHLGYLLNEQGRRVDQVLATVFKAPNSYTKENVVEISCHGSPYIQQEIMELFLRHGARMAKEGEFTLRAFLNGQLDLAQAEAVADLIAADSAAAHSLAMKQMRGGFSDQIKKLREELIHFASMIELELDFGEEDVEFANREELLELVERIRGVIHQLMDSFKLGNVMKHGVNTVIAGRPNAGKSTLLNALLNEERAIVSDIAGTTRDTIEETLNIEGVLFRLVDTAGIRDASDQIEAIGVEKTFEKVAQSSILVYLYDVNETTPPEVEADLNRLYKEGMQVLVLANKVDIQQDRSAEFAQKGWDAILEGLKKRGFCFLEVSAKEGTQLEVFKKQLAGLVLSGKLEVGDVMVSNLRHVEALREAEASLASVVEGLDIGISGDLLAMDIRHALRHLGEITGQVDVEDLLENIFSKFCIGK